MIYEENADDSEQEIRNLFSDLTRDIVGEREYTALRRRIAQMPSGTWMNLLTAAEEIAELKDRLIAFDLQSDIENNDIYVMWLPHPQNHDYILFYFYTDEKLLTNTATYHKEYL